jgi:hypothetical protein
MTLKWRIRPLLVDFFRKTDALSLYEEFCRSQWLSVDEVRALQLGRFPAPADTHEGGHKARPQSVFSRGLRALPAAVEGDRWLNRRAASILD